MKSGYFNSPIIKPLVTAAAQHTGAYTKADVYFDWTSFEIPRGVARLIGATVSVRSKGDAALTPNDGGIDLIFAKDSAVSATPTSIGTQHAAGPTLPIANLIGNIEISSGDFVEQNAAGVAQSIGTTNHSHPLIFEPEPNSGGNVGVDKYWVAGITASTPDHSSILVINDANINAAAHTTVVTGGTGIDAREHFLVGDVLHAHDGVVGGEITAVAPGGVTFASATSGAGDTTTFTDGDTLYNVHPIEITLHFEK